MIASSNVLYGASSNAAGSIRLLKATTSLTPVTIVEDDTGKTVVYRAEPGGDTIPDPEVHKVQPINLRGPRGNGNKNDPHTDTCPDDILEQHFKGDRYLGCSAYTNDLKSVWVQIDCDHSFDQFLQAKGVDFEKFRQFVRIAVDKVNPEIKFGIFRTRNNYAINFYFDYAISRRHQQALFMVIYSLIYSQKGVTWPLECLPDNPFNGQHPTGRTPIMRGFAIRDPEAVRGVGCLIDGPIDVLLQGDDRSVAARMAAADAEDDLCADLWNEADYSRDLERVAQGFAAKGCIFSDDMREFYGNLKDKDASQPSGNVPATTGGGATAAKHKDAAERDREELDEMIYGIAERKNLEVSEHFLHVLHRMSPCLLNKMWDPEVGKAANQNDYARHLLVEVQRVNRVGLVTDEEMPELFRLLCHLSMDDGDSPGEVERSAIKPYVRRLPNKAENQNPSCSLCRSAGLCNKDLCSTAQGGFLKENGDQALAASGVHPICKTFCRPIQLVVRVNNDITSIPFPHALKLAPVRLMIESAGTTAPRLPKEKAYAATVSGLPQLTLDEIYKHPDLRGRRVSGLHSLDARLLRYMKNHWVEPLESARKVEGPGEDRPKFTQLGGSTVCSNDTTLFFGWEDLVAAAASVIAVTSSSYGAAEVPPSIVAGLFNRPDTEAVTFEIGVQAPLPYGVSWCSLQLEEFHQLADRNARFAPQ